MPVEEIPNVCEALAKLMEAHGHTTTYYKDDWLIIDPSVSEETGQIFPLLRGRLIPRFDACPMMWQLDVDVQFQDPHDGEMRILTESFAAWKPVDGKLEEKFHFVLSRFCQNSFHPLLRVMWPTTSDDRRPDDPETKKSENLPCHPCRDGHEDPQVTVHSLQDARHQKWTLFQGNLLLDLFDEVTTFETVGNAAAQVIPLVEDKLMHSKMLLKKDRRIHWCRVYHNVRSDQSFVLTEVLLDNEECPKIADAVNACTAWPQRGAYAARWLVLLVPSKDLDPEEEEEKQQQKQYVASSTQNDRLDKERRQANTTKDTTRVQEGNKPLEGQKTTKRLQGKKKAWGRRLLPIFRKTNGPGSDKR